MDLEHLGTESMEALKEGWGHVKPHRSWLDFSDVNNCISFLENTHWVLRSQAARFLQLAHQWFRKS